MARPETECQQWLSGRAWHLGTLMQQSLKHTDLQYHQNLPLRRTGVRTPTGSPQSAHAADSCALRGEESCRCRAPGVEPEGTGRVEPCPCLCRLSLGVSPFPIPGRALGSCAGHGIQGLVFLPALFLVRQEGEGPRGRLDGRSP